MKKPVIYFFVSLLLSSQIVLSQNMQKEIESTIESIMQSSMDKDIDKSMSFWNNSDDFLLIVDGHEYNITQLREMYENFLGNMEKQEVLKNSVEVTPLGKYIALCIWKGTESIKMKDSETVEANWISTLIMENKKGGWVIIHGHTTHY
ncbi:YybH family protein [Carboxylicivirga caseinilyticus]|uniref:YybH family protein n=1 Tax=Carboxylicivirga caseinilyticus TaxID=3417572 RepID=UPI003D349135|nr:nuclear transport factor 2 family protein [Marinilabiliaceae bacterium A049]